MKKAITIYLILNSLFFYSIPVFAFESSSASFEIHAGDVESTTGTSTSASFGLHNAGGQNAVGTSTGSTKQGLSGILYWLYGFFTARYEQGHYRWRNDNGDETTATWPAFEDTEHISFPKNTAKRLRFEVSNEGWSRGSPPSFMLEFAELSSGSDCVNGPFTTGYTAVLTDYSLDMHLSTSTQISDATATTDFGGSLTNENATFVAGQIKTTGNTTSAITLESDKFTEVEYGVSATSLATDGARYCFRLNDNLSPTRMVYSSYAKAQLASGLPATGMLDSAVFDTFTTAGAGQGPAYNSIMWKGNINGSLGKVQFQLATSDSSSGPWNFYGSQSGTCNTSNYYDTTGPDAPVELSCSPTYHNNQRYFRYRVRLCSAGNCTDSGSASPIVDDVVVNWAP